ncbi:MAG: serine hydrolase domain-containing protein [Aliiglaciecola sp.]
MPGINVAIADSSGVVWAKGYGVADIENNVAMTAKHKMRIGSVAKLITVAGMMRQVEQGELDLDAPVKRYVSSWPELMPTITLRQLASHSSGIRHYNSQEEFLLNENYDSVVDSLELFKHDPLLFAPGTEYKYSTFAFSLIAAAMEGASSGKSFKQIITAQVLEPLNLDDTVFDDQADIIPLRQRPYHVKDGKLINAPQSDHSYKYAGGGFLATPSDISQFAVAHTQPGFLAEQTRKEMLSRATLTDGTDLPYGIGWMIDFDNFINRSYYVNNPKAQELMASFDNAVMHSGGSNGGTTMMILCRDHNRAITVVKNVDGEYSADVVLLALEGLRFYHM